MCPKSSRATFVYVVDLYNRYYNNNIILDYNTVDSKAFTSSATNRCEPIRIKMYIYKNKKN